MELLVVIAIVGILSAAAVLSFGNIGRASSGRGAADLAASMALSARVEAMSHGYGSLLIIDNGSDPQRKLQRMGVMRFTNSAGPPELAGRMTPLPRGSFFLPEYSTTLPSTNLTIPPGPGQTPVYFLKYDGNGHLIEPQTADLVFAPNVMDTSGGLQNPDTMIAARQGFKIRRNGRPMFFKSPDDMPKTP